MPQEKAGDAGGAPISGRRRGTAQKALMTALALGLTGVVGGVGTWSAFSATTENTNNDFAAGTVVISDNDANASMFTMSNMKPGDTQSRCIKVSYTGSLPSDVTLYGARTDTAGSDGTNDLAVNMTLKLTRGTDTDHTNLTCDGFVADAVDYTGGPTGNGVIFDGDLSTYPVVGGTHIADPDISWTNGEFMVYKVDATLKSTAADAAQGDAVDQSFTWKATNE